MSERPELWQALLPVVDALDSLKVDDYIGGSVASSFTGVARATQDADLIADLRPARRRRRLEEWRGWRTSPANSPQRSTHLASGR